MVWRARAERLIGAIRDGDDAAVEEAIVGVMMVCYVAVPSRLIGVKATQSRRDKLAASAVGGVIGAVVCAPAYVLGRVGLLMLGSHTLFILGCIVFGVGLILQAGATGAVKALKMSVKLVSGSRPGTPALSGLPMQHTPLWWTDGVGQAVPGHLRLRRT